MSVTANCHVFDGRVNARPLRLLLTFDDGRALRLSVAADGYRMMVDDLALEEPFEMGDYGGVIVADVTQSLDPGLSGAKVKGVRSLQLEGQQIGVQLLLASGGAFHIWVDGDELLWGDEKALVVHDWLDGLLPVTANEIRV